MKFEKSEDRYLSVITNFGCHYSCPYCIVTNCNINVPKTTVEGLQGLETAIVKNGCNWVSVSGGGDPLHNFYEHRDWWNEFHKIISNLNVKTELHTSYLPDAFSGDMSPYWRFNRVVYHCHKVTDLFRVKRCLGQIVRVVYVVTEDFTEEMINDISAIVKHHPNIDELSFRQMIDKNYQATHYCEEYLKAGHKKDWWYIEQCDYNLYYAENEVKYRYEDFK